MQIKNLNKEYKKGNLVLKDIDIIFRNKEFVSILGASGSGKSTFLNIIGCLDNNYNGEIYLKGKSISNKKSKFYDAFHNQRIGFVHQDYNLFENYSVYKNIEIAMIIGKKKNKRKKVLNILTKVGMINYKSAKVKNLSGGEKQRIAIARALVNDPNIILLDEPTGALDTETSNNILNLIKKISSNKLVIMVTHNEYLAKKYSTRIIKIKDGELIEDSNPCITENEEPTDKLKKVGISFIQSFKLALKNLKTKPLRNILTLIGITISLIGISLVFSISSGFNKQIESLKENTLGNYPIIINSKNNVSEKTKKNKIYPYENNTKNNINKELTNYLSKMDQGKILGMTYNYNYNFNVIANSNNSYKFSNNFPFIAIPNDNKYIIKNYQLLKGSMPTKENEILIKLDNDNKIDSNILKVLSINKKEVNYEDLLNKKIKIVLNNELYKKINDMYFQKSIDKQLYNNSNNMVLTITGIIKSKDDMEFNTLVNEDGGAIYFQNSLIEKVITINSKSNIIKEQLNQNNNVFTKEKLNSNQKEELLTSLGNRQNPFLIYIYPKDYKSKKNIIKNLKNYNFQKNNMEYNDLSEKVIQNVKNIVFGITTVLIIFSFISLIITLILITVITYTSVLERKKEIGILRSLGTPKKDIRKLFIKETTIISLVACLISIVIVKISITPLNKYLYSLVDINNLMIFDQNKILLVLLISIIVSILGSIIPAYKISVSNTIKNLK